MSDQDELRAQLLAGEEDDDPAEREEELLRWLGTSPQVFRAAIIDALEHARTAPADPQAQPWVPLGPRNVGGAIRSFAQDPRNPQTLFAGAAQGGLYKSEDEGYTWRSVGEPDLVAPIGALAIAPSNHRVVYAGTGESWYSTGQTGVAGRGLFRSVDGGEQWVRLVAAVPTAGAAPDGAANFYGRIVVDPQDPRRIWSATERGLWRRNAAGGFVREPVIPASPGAMVTDVVMTRDPGNPDNLVLLAGVETLGIARGVWDRAANTTAWAAPVNPFPANLGRVRLALWEPPPGWVPVGTEPNAPVAYAVGQVTVGNTATPVFRSADLGATWPAAPGATAPPGTAQTFYNLTLAVDPEDPARVLFGAVDVSLSVDSGVTWPRLVLDWRLYDQGDRAQHADIHALQFDVRRPPPLLLPAALLAAAGGRPRRRLWLCSDGGVSTTPDFMVQNPPPPVPAGFGAAPTPKPAWRKKSYGIGAAQFVDVTTHQTRPHIYGGGMQDNGTWVSFGGPTWYRLFGADGGAMTFDAGGVQRFVVSQQTHVFIINLAAPPAAAPFGMNHAVLPDLPPPGNVMVPVFGTVFPNGANPPFIGNVEGHPTAAGRLLFGRNGFASYTNNFGTNIFTANAAAVAGDVSATAFAANSNDLWIGDVSGQLFTTTALPVANAPAQPAWTPVALPVGVPADPIASIVVHPANDRVVAVSMMGAGRVILSHDKGANFTDITNNPAAAGGSGLPPGATPALAWDPTDPTVLYAATLAGVFVCRNLPAPGAAPGAAVPAFNPRWRTFNNGLPLLQTNDLNVVPVRNVLRCATHGRGIFEANLPGATPAPFRIPEVLLLIRQTVVEDGYTYVPANTVASDPRLVPSPAFSATAAYDIRVDAPGFTRSEAFDFGEAIDGTEFDEQLVSDRPLMGDVNYVYVQVANRGSGTAVDTEVHLYYANAGNPAAEPPIVAAELNFPDEPQEASAWKRVGPPRTLGPLRAGQPSVVRFEWIPPLDIADNLALLAVCRTAGAQDPLAAIPGGPVQAFTGGERRAALRVTAVNRDPLHIRDGVDDDGRRGLVAWGGRSPDIIVRQGTVDANPAGTFTALDAHHLEDRVRPGQNWVYVRVTNRTQVAVNARVRLHHTEAASPAPGSAWHAIDAVQNVNGIPAGGSGFATFSWPGVDNPGGAAPGFTLVAAASVTDAAGAELDPFPDPAAVTGVDEFWRYATREPLANNVAVRSLRFEP
ncbi:MAG TPA: hypothetical protein VFQ45_16530 [Longimicrobium sp.]|nr:hypothetical protein [Longimicrobium sp.]